MLPVCKEFTEYFEEEAEKNSPMTQQKTNCVLMTVLKGYHLLQCKQRIWVEGGGLGVVRLLGNSSQVGRKKIHPWRSEKLSQVFLEGKKGKQKDAGKSRAAEDHRLCAGEPSAQGVQREMVKAVYDNHRTEMKASISTHRTQPQCVCGHSNPCLLFCCIMLALDEMLWE